VKLWRWLTAASLLALRTQACEKSQPRSESAAFRPLDVGATVPAYAVRSFAGDTVRLGGTEPATVLNVWATWCTSCREEMAALDSLNREFGSRGVRVVGVSVDESDSDRVRRFAESNHLTFTVAHDSAGDIQRSYQLVGVPTTFVIARDGRLLWRHTGNITETFAEVRSAVEKAVSPVQ
jgi:peroxiredoxin